MALKFSEHFIFYLSVPREGCGRPLDFIVGQYYSKIFIFHHSRHFGPSYPRKSKVWHSGWCKSLVALRRPRGFRRPHLIARQAHPESTESWSASNRTSNQHAPRGRAAVSAVRARITRLWCELTGPPFRTPPTIRAEGVAGAWIPTRRVPAEQAGGGATIFRDQRSLAVYRRRTCATTLADWRIRWERARSASGLLRFLRHATRVR